jgi:hypothetical protein
MKERQHGRSSNVMELSRNERAALTEFVQFVATLEAK